MPNYLENKKLVVTDTNGTIYVSPLDDFPGVMDVMDEQKLFAAINEMFMAVQKVGVPFIRMDNTLVRIDKIVSIAIVEYENTAFVQ